jgi:predicted nucleotidyltransferase
LLDLSRASEDLLGLIEHVVNTMLSKVPALSGYDVMLVGARCRDVIHTALGGEFSPVITRDLDLALALSSWDAYEDIRASFKQVGDTGIRFQIGGLNVDLMPFGELEDPRGIVVPPPRGEAMSVWAFQEIFNASLPLGLSPELAIRVPTVAGFAAAKMAAWLDRSEWREVKDAADLALIAYWYAESEDVQARLYATPGGQETLLAEELDVPRAAARLLGDDLAATIGPDRTAELLDRWPGDIDMLVGSFSLRAGPDWPGEKDRRRDIIDALTHGLRGG